jgi:putative transposase
MGQDGADDATWAEAHRRERVIRPLISATTVDAAAARQAMAELGISRSRLFELLRNYRADPQALTLLPRKSGRIRGERRLSEQHEALIARALADCYLTSNKPSVAAVRRWLRHECMKAGVPVPSTKAIQARIDAIPPKQVVAAREGPKAAADRFRPISGSLEASYALELVQSDHALVDVIVVDDVYRQPIGRPWLTLMIDIASRTVPGFHLTMLRPSAVSVGMAMRHAVLPKAPWLAERGMVAPWADEGLMDRLHLDNSREHHSNALKRGCRVHSIDLQYRPRKQPHWGGHIERLIGTMMGAVHLLPGTTFSNVEERGDYDAEGAACMTLSEIEAWLASQIIGPYHADVHGGIGIPPALAWEEALARRRECERLPADPAQFLFDFLPCEMRAVTPEGIELFNTHYWGDALSSYYTRPGKKMPIRWDPRDMSRVWLEFPDGDHLEVPYRDLRRPAITRWEQLQAQRDLRERGRSAVNEQLIFDAVETQRLIVEQAARTTKAARLAQQRTTSALQDALRSRTPVPQLAATPGGEKGTRPRQSRALPPGTLPFPVVEMKR